MDDLRNAIRDFFSEMPVVSFSTPIDGAHLVIADNYQGMYSMISHLITTHNAKKIAYISGIAGNADSNERFEAYQKALSDNNIAFNDALVEPGDFWYTSGKNAVSSLLDSKGIEFDAIVGANDCMAIGAYWELERRGFNIPEQIIVGGFDNISTGIYLDSPLTTINQPMGQLGAEGMQLMLSLIENKQPPSVRKVPCSLVIRKSCRCSYKSNKQSNQTAVDNCTFESAFKKNKKIALYLLKNYLSDICSDDQYDKWATDFAEALLRNDESEDKITSAIKQIIQVCIKKGYEISFLAEIVNSFIINAEHLLSTDKIVGVISSVNEIIKITERNIHKEMQDKFYQQVSTSHRGTVDVDIIITMSRLRIYFRYEFSQLKTELLLFAFFDKDRLAKPHFYHNEREIDVDTLEPYPLEGLIPEHFLSLKNAVSLVIIPIFNDTTKQGYVVIPFGALHPFSYNLWGQEINALLKVLYFVEESERYSKNLESIIEERTKSLVETQKNLSIAAHQAGMAEIATQLLHNVGNTTNSLFSSAEKIKTLLENSSSEKFKMLRLIINQNQNNLHDFLVNDERGKLIPTYLDKICKAVENEREELQNAIKQLSNGLVSIESIIKGHQKYAEYTTISIELNIVDAVENVLKSLGELILENHIVIRKAFSQQNPIALRTQPAKLHHILTSAIQNSVEAMAFSEKKEITISLKKEEKIQITISDTGEGILPEYITDLFRQGFTMKKGHLGLGLHTSINFAREMGGNMEIQSGGKNCGTTVQIFLPI